MMLRADSIIFFLIFVSKIGSLSRYLVLAVKKIHGSRRNFELCREGKDTWVIKMNDNNLGKLLIEIEDKRRELYDIYLFEPQNKEKLVKLSQELD